MENAKTYLKYIFIGIIVFSLGVFAGYELLPAQVTIQTKEVEKIVEKIVEKKVVDTNKDTTETRKPDGTVIVITHETSKTTDDTTTQKKDDKVSESKTVKEYGTHWKTAVMYKQNLSDFNQDIKNFGVGVEYKVLGPVSVGGFGFLDKTVGVSIGLGF